MDQNQSAWMWWIPACRLDGLAFWGVVALLIRSQAFVAKLQPYRLIFAWVAGIAVCAIEFLVGIALHVDGARHMYSWGHVGLAAVFSFMLFSVLLNQGRSIVAPLRMGVLMYCGSISYSMYLFHPICLLTAFRIFGREPRLHSLSDFLVVSGAIAGTWVISGLFMRPIERRLIGYGRRFAY